MAPPVDRCETRRHPDVEPELVAGICELVLQARDTDLLKRFYVQVFGFKVLSEDDDRIWLACGRRTRLGIWTPGEKEFGDQGGRHVHFALSAGRGRLQALAQRLSAQGAEFEGPVEHEGGDRSIYVEDPEGNVVEVWDFFEHGEGATAGVAALA